MRCLGSMRALWCVAARGRGAFALVGRSRAAAKPAVDPARRKGLPAFYAVPHAAARDEGQAHQVAEGRGRAACTERCTASCTSSLNLQNKPVAVTGVIAVPNGTPPAGGFPVVSWGHGTNGMADVCAPSLSPSSDIPLANSLLDQGWVVTASDYQGEGTPGLHPYIAGVRAARNTIDIVRVARQIEAAHASKHYVVWGHSEGGQTAMFALHIGATYAPTLALEGVVAGAPPSQFALLYTFLKNSPFRHYLLMAAGGLNKAYGNTAAPLNQVLTPLGIKHIADLDKGCTVVHRAAARGHRHVAAGEAGPVQGARVEESADGKRSAELRDRRAPAPLLMIQGGNDEQIPVVSTQILATHLCNIGQNLERWIYPGQSHAGVIGPSADDMIHWIGDRFAGGRESRSVRADRSVRHRHHRLPELTRHASAWRVAPSQQNVCSSVDACGVVSRHAARTIAPTSARHRNWIAGPESGESMVGGDEGSDARRRVDERQPGLVAPHRVRLRTISIVVANDSGVGTRRGRRRGRQGRGCTRPTAS